MNYKSKIKTIRTFIFDVDGVFTDGSVTLLPDGAQSRQMNTRDGYAVQLAVKRGYNVCIITGGRDQMVKKRLEGLGITEIYLGQHDKIEALEDYKYAYDIDLDTAIYMGDDMPDYEVMQKIGLPACPSDAVSEIKTISMYISPFKGGKGCVRDIIEQTLKVQGKWMNDTQVTSV